MSTESTEHTRTTDLAAAALTAMADAAAAIERVLPGLLAVADTLPELIAVRVKAASAGGPEINLQPRTVAATHAWADYLGGTVTIEDSHTDYSTGRYYRRGATADIECAGVRVHIGSCTFYSPDEWAELQAAEDPCHSCGCPKRFDRHADGCPAPTTAVMTLADAHAGGDAR